MRILISADMEGISGVCRWEQVAPGSPEYPTYQKLMTEEVNTAIRGALDARAELSRGAPVRKAGERTNHFGWLPDGHGNLSFRG